MNMNVNQMELELKRKQGRMPARQKPRRSDRAQWWFEEMRRVVNSTLEWKPEKSQG
jgi:hypothetical protein